MCFAPQRRSPFRRPRCQNCSGREVLTFNFQIRSRHDGVQFCQMVRTHRFSNPTFRPSRGTRHWKKHSVLRLVYLIAHLHLLSSDPFSSLRLCFLRFSSLTLASSPFPSVGKHLSIVGSLTSKFPSVYLCTLLVRRRKPKVLQLCTFSMNQRNP